MGLKDRGLDRKRAIVQDSIHGSIMITEAEYILLQTPFLRRLHNVKQLGFSFLVFPSATHTRLSHSIGVMHLASKMVDNIIAKLVEERSCKELLGGCGVEERRVLKKLARIAGLIHDIGHLPYSHMFEDSIDYLVKSLGYKELKLVKEIVESEGSSKIHEMIGHKFAETLSRIAGRYSEVLGLLVEAAAEAVFSREPFKRVEELGLPWTAGLLVRQIISHSVVDADRLDYLRRDAWFTGVVYGYTDLERVYEGIGVAIENGRPLVVYDRKSYQSIEDVFDSRFKMYRTVYFHHKVLSISHALKKLLTYISREWSEVAPRTLEGLEFHDLLNPDVLSEGIGDGRFYFDDSEFDSIVRNVVKGGSKEAVRWARCFMHERALLPISIVKRQDELVSIIEDAVGVDRGSRSVYERFDVLNKAINHLINGSTIHEIKEQMVRRVSKISGVREDRIVIDFEIRPTSGSKGEFDTLYIKMLDNLMTLPVVVPLVYSDHEHSHRRLYKYRTDIRKEFRNIVSNTEFWREITG